MPWELPRRKRGQGKSSGTGRFAAAAVVVVAAAGIITVGALSIRAAATSGITSETDLALPALVGTGVPLAILALGWLRLRRRVTAVVLAFTLGLGTNVIYLASAVPAAAVTDNSSVFTFKNSSNFGSIDMAQHYSPSSGSATTCPTSLSANWACGFASDTFTTGQTMNAGTAQADLYLENQGSITNDYTNGYTFFAGAGGVTAVTLNKMANLVSGDVIIAQLAVRGGTALGTITKPSASWNLVDRIDSGTTITLAVYSLVAGSSEPASYTWSWTGSQSASAVMRNYSGVDTSAPVDGHAGATESVASTTHVAPSVNAAYANEMRVVGIADASVGTCNTISGWNLSAVASSGSNKTAESHFYSTTPAGLGATGTLTATCGNDIAATHQLTLKPSTTPSCTVTATVKKTTPITTRATSSNSVTSGTSIVLNVPAGTQNNDVMLVYVAIPAGGNVPAPTGWTGAGSAGGGGTNLFYFRRVAASEPATYTFTPNVTGPIAGWIGSYIGVDTTNPLDVNRSGTATSGTTHSTPTMTTTVSGDMIVAAFSLPIITAMSTPSGMTAEGNPTAGTSVNLAVFDGVQTSAGAISATTTTSVSTTSSNDIMSLRPIASNTVTLGSATTVLGSIASPTLRSVSISTSAATFATGDRLVFELSVPNDAANCGVRLSYDEASTPSKLTVATIVPEGIAGLLLLAPALPFGARWWKRRRP
jgi:hypothetical protein